MATPTQQYTTNKVYGADSTGNKKSMSYLEQEVYSWSKEKLVLKMYDLFIVSAKRGDTQKMSRVLIELMGALNFHYEETSTRLYRLYEYCQRCIFQKKIDEALYIITELRNTWAQAFNLEERREPAIPE